MFEITEETRQAAIDEMAKIIYEYDHDANLNDEAFGKAFDKAVEIVMKQFGM